MALHGDVATFSVGDLLDWLALRRATGTLSLSREMAVRWFQLRGGEIVLASSSEQELLLGRLLIERGLIGDDELAQALTTHEGAARLGRRLVKAGAVTQADLEAVLHEKVRRLLLDALTWDTGKFTFTAGETKKARAAVAVSFDLARFRADVTAANADEQSVAEADVIDERELVPSRAWPWPAT